MSREAGDKASPACPLLASTSANFARNRPPLPVPYAAHKAKAQGLPGTGQMKLVEEGRTIPLSDVAKHHSTQLPQLFLAKSNYKGPPAVKEGELLMVQYKKTVKVAYGTTTSGHRITLHHNCKLLLTRLETEESRTFTAKTLLSSNSLPLAMIVMKPFEDPKKQVIIQTGTILLNTHTKREGRCSDVIVAEDTSGQIVTITASCTGVFSIHPQDIQLHLVQLVHTCKLPVKVYLESSPEAVTLRSIVKQEVLVAQPFSECHGKPETSETYEFPADCNLQVVRIVSLAIKQNVSKIQYYSIFRKPEGDDDGDDDGSYQYAILGESPVQWRKGVSRQHSDVILASTQQSSGTLSAAGASASLDSTVKQETIKNNLTYLRSLRLDEVLELLEAMQLEEYREYFKKENIDGEVLSSLTEADLLRELNMQKRLHRVRLMKVIEGIYSVQVIFRELYI